MAIIIDIIKNNSISSRFRIKLSAQIEFLSRLTKTVLQEEKNIIRDLKSSQSASFCTILHLGVSTKWELNFSKTQYKRIVFQFLFGTIKQKKYKY